MATNYDATTFSSKQEQDAFNQACDEKETLTKPSSYFYSVVLCHDNHDTILEVGNFYDLYINAVNEDYFHIDVDFTEDEVITLSFHKSEVGNYVYEVWETTDYSHIDNECTGYCDECSAYGTLCNGLV